MQLLSGFTDAPQQSISFALSDGSRMVFRFEFRERQLGWFFDLTYGDFVLRGQRLAIHPNILRSFKNLIPFGLAVVTDQRYEPQDIGALTDGTVRLYLYEGAAVDEVEAIIEE